MGAAGDGNGSLNGTMGTSVIDISTRGLSGCYGYFSCINGGHGSGSSDTSFELTFSVERTLMVTIDLLAYCNGFGFSTYAITGLSSNGDLVAEARIMDPKQIYWHQHQDRVLLDYILTPGTTYTLIGENEAYSNSVLSPGSGTSSVSEVSASITTRFVVEPGDLNVDGIVDGADLAMLLSSWGACADCPEDINQDGEVDGADLAYVLGYWTL